MMASLYDLHLPEGWRWLTPDAYAELDAYIKSVTHNEHGLQDLYNADANDLETTYRGVIFTRDPLRIVSLATARAHISAMSPEIVVIDIEEKWERSLGGNPFVQRIRLLDELNPRERLIISGIAERVRAFDPAS